MPSRLHHTFRYPGAIGPELLKLDVNRRAVGRPFSYQVALKHHLLTGEFAYINLLG